jgi:hypothetical protein
MLIINESAVEGDCFLGSASEVYCRQVVIRIAIYQNRISNRIYFCFDLKQLFSNPHYGYDFCCSQETPSPYIKQL